MKRSIFRDTHQERKLKKKLSGSKVEEETKDKPEASPRDGMSEKEVQDLIVEEELNELEKEEVE